MELDGLPLHVLLVHVVVVVVPLAALVAVLSLWPAARQRLGVAPPLLALLPVLLVPVNVEAGEWLLARVAPTEQVLRHADLGMTLVPWSIAVFGTCSLHWWWHRHTGAATSSTSSMPRPRLRTVMSALTAIAVVAAAIGSVVTVVRIGESGTAAVWRDAYSEDPITD